MSERLACTRHTGCAVLRGMVDPDEGKVYPPVFITGVVL